MLQSHRGVSYSAARSDPGGQPFSGTSMLELEFAQLSDPGKVRGHNEDFIGYAEPSTPEQARTHGWLFVLPAGCAGAAPPLLHPPLPPPTLSPLFSHPPPPPPL